MNYCMDFFYGNWLLSLSVEANLGLQNENIFVDKILHGGHFVIALAAKNACYKSLNAIPLVFYT